MWHEVAKHLFRMRETVNVKTVRAVVGPPDLKIVTDGERVFVFDELSFGGYLKAAIYRDTGMCGGLKVC